MHKIAENYILNILLGFQTRLGNVEILSNFKLLNLKFISCLEKFEIVNLRLSSVLKMLWKMSKRLKMITARFST